MMFILWIIIGFGIYYFLKNNNGSFDSKDSRSESNAEELLKQKYVNGEINEETYVKMIKTIRS